MTPGFILTNVSCKTCRLVWGAEGPEFVLTVAEIEEMAGEGGVKLAWGRGGSRSLNYELGITNYEF